MCLTLCDPMDCKPPGSSVHGILQARILEWFAMPSSKGSSQPRDPNPGLPHCRQFLYRLSQQQSPPFPQLQWDSHFSTPLDFQTFLSIGPTLYFLLHPSTHPSNCPMYAKYGRTHRWIRCSNFKDFFFFWWAFLAFWIFSSALKCEMSPVHWNSPLFSMYFPLLRTSILLPLLSYSIPLHNFCLAGLLERALE